MNFLRDEEKGFNEMKKLRSEVEPRMKTLVKEVNINSLQKAVTRGIEIIARTLLLLQLRKLNIHNNTDPGHGVGHWIRDLQNALRFIPKLNDIDPKELFVGLVAGALHDIGCGVIPRYEEHRRVVRHAEAGALLLLDLFNKKKLCLNEAEQLLICYAIAAHTHYLQEKEVNGRIIKPYKDTINGRPFYPVWIPRWIDRLDCNGPYFVIRHYLTLHDHHRDFCSEQQKFYEVDYFETMQPRLREKRTGKKTMLEHLKMFMDSQNNRSPYGKWDRGVYIELRENYKRKLNRIIQAVLHPEPIDEKKTIVAWRAALKKAEPINGEKAAEKLENLFRSSLNKEAKLAWLSGFHTTILEAAKLDEEIRRDIGMHLKEVQKIQKIFGIS